MPDAAATRAHLGLTIASDVQPWPPLPPPTRWQRFSTRHLYLAAALVMAATLCVTFVTAYFLAPWTTHTIGVGGARLLSIAIIAAWLLHRIPVRRWLLDRVIPAASLGDWHRW